MAVVPYTVSRARAVLWRLILGAIALVVLVLVALVLAAWSSGLVRAETIVHLPLVGRPTVVDVPRAPPNAAIYHLPGYTPPDYYPDIAERDRLWRERCDIKLVWGEHGVRKYVNNGKPGCTNGQWED